MNSVKHQCIELGGSSRTRKGSNGLARRLMPPDRNDISFREEVKIKRMLGTHRKHTEQVNAMRDVLVDENKATESMVAWFKRNEDYCPPKMVSAMKFLVRAYNAALDHLLPAHAVFEACNAKVDGKTIGALARDPQILEKALTAGKETVRIASIAVQTKNKIEEIVGEAQKLLTVPS